MNFLDELHRDTNRASETANGALSNTSTLDPLLDFFSKAGAMRGREKEAYVLFEKAFAADKLNAIRCLFYLRDIRGGQGERSVFRYILSQLNQDLVNKVSKYIPDYGRWDEVPINDFTIELIGKQLEEDEARMKAGKSVSLLAKWLPSENASSKTQRNAARKIATQLSLLGKPVQVQDNDFRTYSLPNLAPYRKKVVALRKHIDLLEQKMSAKKWMDIKFEKLPSQAHKKHVKAFYRHQDQRYREYLEKVNTGEAKINSGTLFTYDIYNMIKGYHVPQSQVDAANALWSGLPDYTRGTNALVLADVSGSMDSNNGLPMAISVSLALYFAEHNEGPFKDYFMTFTTKSRLQKINGNNLKERMDSIERADWHGSTNVQSAFDAILRSAQTSKASPDDMPKVLYIISDMQFNVATSGNDKTNFEVMKEKYRDAGYELPHVVFWNVNAFGKDSPATKHDENVTLISGASQSTFKYVIEGKTPLESMMEVLGSERYTRIEF